MDSNIKKAFPIFQRMVGTYPLLYLDTAATAQKPKQVIDFLAEFYLNQYGTVHRGLYTLSAEATESYNKARAEVSRFLNASFDEEIIFTRGTTDGINLVANALRKGLLREGDEILLSALEHHSNIVPWQMAAEETGAILKIIPLTKIGEIDLKAYTDLLSEKTKVVSIAHVSNVLGTINPIEQMAREAHSKGAIFCVDGAQGAPHLRVDVQKLGCDFYTFSGHKVYGPNGIGVLYGKKEILDWLSPSQGGGDMIDQVSFEKTTYNVSPLKFEAGTPPIAEAIGLGAAIRFLDSIGMEKIEAHESLLGKQLQEGLKNISGLSIYGESSNKRGIVSFSVEGIHPLDLSTFLDFKGVAVRSGHLCAQPLLQRLGVSSLTRASIGIYNDSQEIDQFLSFLQEAIKKLRG